jgi:mevalonate pyrophosphate decarboxylase
MDAGPHVKVLCSSDAADEVQAVIESVAGVERVIRCAPGPDARLLSAEEWRAAR